MQNSNQTLTERFKAFLPVPETLSFQYSHGKIWVYGPPTGASVKIDPDSLDGFLPQSPQDLTVTITTVDSPFNALATGLTTMARTPDGETQPLISSGMWRVDLAGPTTKPLKLKAGATADVEVPASGNGDRKFIWTNGDWKDQGVLSRVVYPGYRQRSDFLSLTTRSDQKTVDLRIVRTFPGAQTVGLVGSFQNWDLKTARPFQKVADGRFQYDQKVAPDFYTIYKFSVDGEWTEEPYPIETKDDGFGGSNGILDVQYLLTGIRNQTAMIASANQLFTGVGNSTALMAIGDLGQWINCDRYPAKPVDLIVENLSQLPSEGNIIAVGLKDFFISSTRVSIVSTSGIKLWYGSQFRLIVIGTSDQGFLSEPITIDQDKLALTLKWQELDLKKIAAKEDWIKLLQTQ